MEDEMEEVGGRQLGSCCTRGDAAGLYFLLYRPATSMKSKRQEEPAGVVI